MSESLQTLIGGFDAVAATNYRQEVRQWRKEDIEWRGWLQQRKHHSSRYVLRCHVPGVNCPNASRFTCPHLENGFRISFECSRTVHLQHSEQPWRQLVEWTTGRWVKALTSGCCLDCAPVLSQFVGDSVAFCWIESP